MKVEKLSKIEIDAITEIVAIGAGHASQALSEMTGKHITVTFPEVKFCPLEKLPEVIGNPGEVAATIYVGLNSEKIDGGRHIGNLIFIFPMDSAIEFSSLILEKENYKVNTDRKELDEMQISTLEETGNILSGASLAAIGKVLDIEIVETLPYFSYDTLASTLSVVMAELAHKTQEALTFKTSFQISGHEVKTYFLLLFEPETLRMLLKRIDNIFHDLLEDYVEDEYR